MINNGTTTIPYWVLRICVHNMHSINKFQTTKFETTLSPKYVVNSPLFTPYQSQLSPCSLNTKSQHTFHHTLASHFGLPPLAKGHETNNLVFAWSFLIILATCITPCKYACVVHRNTHQCLLSTHDRLTNAKRRKDGIEIRLNILRIWWGGG